VIPDWIPAANRNIIGMKGQGFGKAESEHQETGESYYHE